jgi:hypothetical protein
VTRAAGVAGLVVLALSLSPSQALAHTGTGAAVAADYEARLDGVRPATTGVRAAAVDGDIKLSLTVDPGRVVVVLGIVGEPFLRFADGAVYANVHSPTAAEIRLVDLRPGASQRPQWIRVHHGRTFAWHESRLRPLRSKRTGLVSRISIPLRIDGRAARVVGSSWHAAPPPLWPWIALGLAPVILVVLAGRWRWPARMGQLVLPVAVLAIASTLTCVVGRTLEPPYARANAIVQIAAAGALALIALVAILRAGRANRLTIAAGVGALVALYAASSLAVVLHGFVLSRLPASVDRGGTVLGLGSGICLVGLFVLEIHARGAPPARRA